MMLNLSLWFAITLHLLPINLLSIAILQINFGLRRGRLQHVQHPARHADDPRQ